MTGRIREEDVLAIDDAVGQRPDYIFSWRIME